MPHIGKTGLITSLPQRAVARSLPVFTAIFFTIYFKTEEIISKKRVKSSKGFTRFLFLKTADTKR